MNSPSLPSSAATNDNVGTRADVDPVAQLIASRGWADLDIHDRIGAAYDFVRDEILFGYNRADDLDPAEVLADGHGQCNTKGNLLFALLTALRVPVRFHGFTIDKALQRGAIPWWLYPLAPKRILHSWVEVQVDADWIPLEGFILDAPYLGSLQRRFAHLRGSFCGFGVATKDLQAPPVQWRGEATYIQREGIVDDFGVFDSPAAFYAKHGTNLSGLRKLLYERFARHAMNRTVERLREGGTRKSRRQSLLGRRLDEQVAEVSTLRSDAETSERRLTLPPGSA